ncbi:type II toxin-antitoxin system RelE/ParE family toxin [Edaphobacter sp.]|uniref:type II toxin-antitoxin system RelE/ParE family toxin n=1 Tax=Edaphobacter sp. TaxID=1934404 RepID=UPI0039C89A6B
MVEIRRTEEFAEWLAKLKDRQGRARILTRIDRLADGNPGNHRNLGGGIFELKIDFGPGYRVYYVNRNGVVIILLCGGDKSTQVKDIRRARALAEMLDIDEEDRR